jgi:putative VirB-like lipoprotein
MRRYILIILSMTILTGCSEMQVIGNSAMRELRSDGMSVERISYNYHQKLAAREKSGDVMMAKAESTVIRDGRLVVEEKKMRVAKAKRVKGLWEKNSL